ncbi:MAG: gluconate 2-dehydrogenase subunit 3 family protein [Bradyrhizobium sp.]|nr:MAG: gluconate 2-dehydrogenase subunit 3 family protein [Bradyrhizobium sp.]
MILLTRSRSSPVMPQISQSAAKTKSELREEKTMTNMGRRGFVKGATLGALAFTVGGVEAIMAPGEARARNVPFRLLDAHQGETLEALGETLVPQAREAGIAHYIDQQLSVPPHEALLQARIFNVRPPFADFYRTAIVSIDESSRRILGRDFAQLSAADQREFVGRMRQNKIEGWTGRPGAAVYAVLRADAVDVVYGTMEGYEALGIPYMPHITPEKRW